MIEKKEIKTHSYTFNVTKNGVFVDGALVSPMTFSSLTAILGEPRIMLPKEKDKSKNYVLIWDEVGIRGFTKDIEKGDINDIDFLLYDDPEWGPNYDKTVHHSRSVFSGTYLIDNKPVIQALPEKELRKAYIFVETKLGNWELSFQLTEAIQKRIEENEDNAVNIIRNTDIPFSWAYIHYKTPRISTGKYLHKKPQGEILVFKNLNFKLAIVEELMYNLRLIEPVFDVYDFARDYAKREIDIIGGEGDEVISEVKKWFKDLPVGVALAEKVESLYIEAGNDIYGQICPYWDGEDDMYDIKAIAPEELAQFPNLKRIMSAMGFSSKVRKQLEANGIEVIEV